MIRTSLPMRGAFLSRAAMAAALALGTAGGSLLVAAPAQAAGPSYSQKFVAAAGPLQKALAEAKARPDVVAAQAKVQAAQKAADDANTKDARAAAGAQVDAAIAALGAVLAPQKTQLEAVYAAVANADDRLLAGQFALQMGGLAMDPSLQRRGLGTMIESGKLAAADQPRLQLAAGQLAFQAKDYAQARTYLQAAIAAGYHANDADVLLAEAYLVDNQATQGLALLQSAIDQRKASGTPAPQSWYRRGLGVAYAGKLNDKAASFASQLAEAYPTKDNWAAAISVVRDVAHYPSQEELDLMRLMGRTNSFVEERDYIEYIQSADARRLPGEVKGIVDRGIASGMLNASSTFVAEALKIATTRLAADKASLPSLDRDAHAAAATVATITGAGDAFLSYDQPAKAAEFYKLALAKPGADLPLVLTRLGISQVDTADYAGAKDSFGRVEGPRKALAQLWTIYAGQKAAGK